MLDIRPILDQFRYRSFMDKSTPTYKTETRFRCQLYIDVFFRYVN